jgi:peptide/nickel transport system permease protein
VAPLLRRLAAALPALFGVVLATFLLTRVLPGDPAALLAGATSSYEAIERIRRELGLDRPLPEQFLRYLAALAQGDLGRSMISGRPVAEELLARLPASLELAVLAVALAVLLGVPLGVLAALRADGPVDHAVRVLVTAGNALPTFFTGLLLVYVFYYLLGWAPSPMGRLDPFLSAPPFVTGLFLVDAALAGDAEVLGSVLAQLALPVATLALYTISPILRVTRAGMLATLSGEMVRAARAHGLPGGMVVRRYALRNALLPLLTILGSVFSFTLGASVLIEKVFAWPGAGLYALDSLIQLDFAPVQGFVLLIAVIYLLSNLAIDILYGIADPRVGLAR